MGRLPALELEDTWSTRLYERSDALIERDAIEFAVTHRARARGRPGLMLRGLSPEAFTALRQLEDHLAGPTQRGSVVSRLLDTLNAAAADIWEDHVIWLVARASMLTVFSNFPLGLLRLPGDSAPLAHGCRSRIGR